MSGWEVWLTNSGVVFPCLQKLCIRSCPKLAEVSLGELPSLRVLEVSGCGDGVLRSLVKVASTVIKLDINDISGLTDDVWRGVIEYIGAVEELRVHRCKEIRYLWESEEAEASKVLVNLRNFYVSHCDNLVSLGKKEEEDGDCGSSLHLTSLEISFCKNLEGCSVPNGLETLYICWCDSVTTISFPSGGGGQKLKSVTIGGCEKVMKTELGGYEGGDKRNMLFNNGSSMSMLEFLHIHSLLNLKFIIELNCFLHLTTLLIDECSSLESFPDQLLDLASLKNMHITDCPRLDFPHGSWPPKLSLLRIGRLKNPILEWGQQDFPTSLVHLGLYGGYVDVIDFSQLSHLLPSSLTRLEIYDFEKLESVSRGVQHLTSLQHLFFDNCPKMKDLPEMFFPSLLSLIIIGCPDLEKRCSTSGSYRPLISDIPCIIIT